jgi:hypothetical protein
VAVSIHELISRFAPTSLRELNKVVSASAPGSGPVIANVQPVLKIERPSDVTNVEWQVRWLLPLDRQT